MEEKDEGLSLGEIVRVIFIKKWLLLIVTVVVMLLGVIFVQAIYNPRKVVYKSTFEIRYPNSETYMYPDGTEFLYKEFISLENLQRTKELQENFSTIDIETMQSKNNISISEQVVTIDNLPVRTGTYTVSISKRYFSSNEQAVDFFKMLASLPIEDIIEKSTLIDYNFHLRKYTLVGDYISQVDSLIDQKNLILDGLDELIKTYSSAITIDLEDGTTKTIVEAQNEIESYFNFYDLDAMKTEVELNGYINPNSDYLDSIKSTIESLKREKEKNQQTIENIYEQIIQLKETLNGIITDTSFQPMFSSIVSLTQRNAEIDYLIDTVYDAYLVGPSTEGYSSKLETFQEKLNSHYQKLQEFTNYYTAFNHKIYELNTKLLNSNGSIITEEGGINIIIALAAFLVIGFILGCCLNLVLDLPKYIKEKNKNEVINPVDIEDDSTIDEEK